MKFIKLKFNPNKADKLMMSIVEKPAIEVDYIKMSEEKENNDISVKLSDDEKQIIYGPALIPDKWIYRNKEALKSNEDGFVSYDKSTVEEIAHYYTSNQLGVTLEHNSVTEELKMVESYIQRTDNNEFNVPEGTWMLSYKVNSPELWDEIKSGKYKGFSIEGRFDTQLLPDVELSNNMDEFEQLLFDLGELN